MIYFGFNFLLKKNSNHCYGGLKVISQVSVVMAALLTLADDEMLHAVLGEAGTLQSLHGVP